MALITNNRMWANSVWERGNHCTQTLKAQLGYILVGVALNTALETLDIPHVIVRNHLDYYPDISLVLKGISWRFPSL